MRINLVRAFWGVVLVIFCGMSTSVAFAQHAETKLPLLIAGELPLYPLMARAARIQGIVTIRVTTDGKNVTSIDHERGPTMLVKYARENVLTWKFADQKPTTFTTTFHYIIEEPASCEYTNGTTVLNLPQEARITVRELMTCDPVTTKTTVK